jgi:hypothetical protein
MIYRQSNDPVFLKKINIDVWLLRDQLEHIILSRLQENPEENNFDDIISEFSPKPKPNLTLLKFEEDEQSSQTSNSNNESDLENPTSDDSNKISKETPQKREVITQRLPTLTHDKICRGKTFLSEIYMDQILFFSDRQFVEGQSIVIQFNVPEKFILNAEVIYSQSYSLKNRIISKSNLPFRVSAQFTFLKEGERTLLRNFLENISWKNDMKGLKEPDSSDNSTPEIKEVDESTNLSGKKEDNSPPP